MEMLHRQAILAISKEMFIHELQIQGPLINIIEGIRYNHIGPTCYITVTACPPGKYRKYFSIFKR